MPKDYRTYSLVAAHLVKNAHRYYPAEETTLFEDSIKCETDKKQMEEEDNCKVVNKCLREIRTLKRQNRIREQQNMVKELKERHGSYRCISRAAGIPLKTVHEWCSEPKNRQHKATSRAKLKKDEFINFLMQDTITYSDSCKRYSGKRFMLHTWEEVYKRYMKQPEFHKNGILSKTSMRMYKPKYILLSGSTPLSQCLCDYCENCELLCKALVAAGVKSIPSNKFACIDSTLCSLRTGQFGSSYTFAPHECITRDCSECGKSKLKVTIQESNAELLRLNKKITWHRWQTVEGSSAPQKCEVKGTLRSGVNELLDIIEDLSEHLFRANWHRNVFQYMQKHLRKGYVLQVMDFAMNFKNWYQDEVQSAYWTGTQTTIHATINFFRCQRAGCTQIVTLALVHISADLKHDSFASRAAQNLCFNYLVQCGVPLDLIIQFCDNCAAQYKSRRPFAEIARCALHIIRVYFGEKHGKSHADALFGRLKAWMSYHIKTRKFVVTDAQAFYRYCREYYQTIQVPDTCQHYRVEFEFMRPSDIRRHQDCDLDQAVPKTQEIYSVHNTDQPLQLKVRAVPCLCPNCVNETGECENSDHTDPWRLVNLIPERGANKKKYQKRKRPDAHLIQGSQQEEDGSPHEKADNSNEEESDDELPDIEFDFNIEELKQRRKKRELNRKQPENTPTKSVTDSVTESVTDARERSCTWADSENVEIVHFEENTSLQKATSDDIEVIDVCERASKEFEMAGENLLPKPRAQKITREEVLAKDLPDCVLWHSVLTSFEACTDLPELEALITELFPVLPELKPRVNATYSPNKDRIDAVAQKEIPSDGPVTLNAIKTLGDGNCLCRALSRAYFNEDNHHIELRVRIIMEGILNKKHYLSDDCLERGAGWVHGNAEFPTVFATFSEYYTPGQRITEDAIECIYCMEIYSLSKLGSYMGLWQLAQASSVLGIPLHTIYPVRGDSTLRNDFHRMFFPVNYPPSADNEPIVIMWTGTCSWNSASPLCSTTTELTVRLHACMK